MRKIAIIAGLGLLFVGILRMWTSSQAPIPTLAIFNTLSHPALDEVREAFITQIKNELGMKIRIAEYNAQGDIQQANMIARQIAQDKNIIGILAIATLAAQTMAKVEKHKPIVVAAVSDLNMIFPDDKPDNICGLTDSIDAQEQLARLRELWPSLSSLALLYSSHEQNSLSMVKKLTSEAKKYQIDIKTIGVQDASQIHSASINACENSEAVLIPLDNQLVALMPAVIKATKNLSCAIISSNESPIHQGASIAFAVNYRESGVKAAQYMMDIITNKKSPEEIAFEHPHDIKLYANHKVLREKKLVLDEQALKQIISIGAY